MAENHREGDQTDKREDDGDLDSTDAKGFVTKFLCGLSKTAMSKLTLEDIEDVEIDKLEVSEAVYNS